MVMANEMDEIAVPYPDPGPEWEQEQREKLEADYEDGLRQEYAASRHEEYLLEASEPGAAEEMANFRARNENALPGEQEDFVSLHRDVERVYFATPWIQQSEAVKLITTVHGEDRARDFVNQIEREREGSIELENGVKIHAISKDKAISASGHNGREFVLADANDQYGNIYQLGFGTSTENTAQSLTQRAGTTSPQELLDRSANKPWVFEPQDKASIEKAIEETKEALRSPTKSEGFFDRIISKAKDLGNSFQPNKSIVEEGTWKLDTETGARILTGARADEISRAVQEYNNTPEGRAERADWERENAERTQAQELTNEAVEKTSKDGTPLRFETSTRTAEYQPGTNTVEFTNKSTSTKTELVPGEGLSGSPESAEAVRSRTEEVFGAKIDRDEFDNSDQPLEIADRAAEDRQRRLDDATSLASHELRTNSQVTLADKNDGIYNGKILGVTDSYLLQRSGPASAVAHDKSLFENLPGYGRDATILYSAGNARLSLQPTKDKGLGIER